MNRCISIELSKSIKLKDVWYKDILGGNPNVLLLTIEKLKNLIKTYGCQPIDPVIQYNRIYNEHSTLNYETKYLIQSTPPNSKFVPESAYMPELVISDYIFAHYEGETDFMALGRSKIDLTAFERNILLGKTQYTFLCQEKDGYVVADFYVEKLNFEKDQ